jgi:peptide/nickel transport system permease protein
MPVSAGAAAPEEFYDAYTFDVEARSTWRLAFRRFRRHRLAFVSVFILALTITAGLLAGQLAPYPYHYGSLDALSSPPTWSHPFGTNQLGRDYLSDILHALGTEVRVLLLVAVLGTTLGTVFGAIAGYFGGVVDNVLMRFTEVLLILPALVTLLVAAAYLHADTLFRVSALLACVLWMPVARQVRAACLTIRERDYVAAARAVGASDLRIILRHVLPNTVDVIAVSATVMIAGAVILETTIAFLFGSGISFYVTSQAAQRTLPSLGDVMAAASQEGVYHWWGIAFPGLVIILLIVPIYLIGDGIRDALDPSGGRTAVGQRSRV